LQTPEPTWLYPLLAQKGLTHEIITLCEEKLVREEYLISLELFSNMSRSTLTNKYLQTRGIKTSGVQQAILDIHTVENQKKRKKDFLQLFLCAGACWYLPVPFMIAALLVNRRH